MFSKQLLNISAFSLKAVVTVVSLQKLFISARNIHLHFEFLQVFTNNKNLCLKVTTNTIEKMVELAMKHNESATELLDLLKAVVKVEELNLPVKRNQLCVMKYLTSYTGKLDKVMRLSLETR